MSSSSAIQKLVKRPTMRRAIERVRQEVFGDAPQLNMRTGTQYLKRAHRGTFLARYYPDNIEKFARMAVPNYTSELQERRANKLNRLRNRGKGPPKKGSGKRAQKKKK